MVVNVGYDKLSEELQKQLSEYSQDITKGLNEVFKDLAEQGVKELQQGKPYHNRTGQYTKNFAVTQRKTASTVQGAESYTIYNKKRYQITHLLEHGHLTRKGTRTAAFKHWQPALDNIDKAAEKAIEKVVRNAGG